YRAQIRIAAALAISVDSALHLRSAVLNRRYRVCHGHIRIIMGVDPDRSFDLHPDVVHNLGQTARQCAAVRVAEDYRIGAGAVGRLERFDGERRIGGEAVKEMFGVVDDLAAYRLQVGNRGCYQVDVFLERYSQRFFHMKIPTLAEYCDYGSFSFYQRLQV